MSICICLLACVTGAMITHFRPLPVHFITCTHHVELDVLLRELLARDPAERLSLADALPRILRIRDACLAVDNADASDTFLPTDAFVLADNAEHLGSRIHDALLDLDSLLSDADTSAVVGAMDNASVVTHSAVVHGCLHGLASVVGHAVSGSGAEAALSNQALLDAAKVCMDVVVALPDDPVLFSAQASRCLRNVSCCEDQGEGEGVQRAHVLYVCACV
jgi:hypothetical protein